jgi:hypothetical protein
MRYRQELATSHRRPLESTQAFRKEGKQKGAKSRTQNSRLNFKKCDNQLKIFRLPRIIKKLFSGGNSFFVLVRGALCVP